MQSHPSIYDRNVAVVFDHDVNIPRFNKNDQFK